MYRFYNLQHIFTKEELKKRIFKSKSGKIRNRLVFNSFLTTLLPLSIVVAYLLMSITSLSEVGLYAPTQGEFKVIFGEYFKLLQGHNAPELIKEVNFYYINVIDTMLLFFGIGAGIVVTIIYLLFFVHWTNSDIVNPVNELLVNMQKTTAGQLENYSMVRTNDELGNLSENYNIMTSKLHEYISHIDKMNTELEQKVKDRTAEIQAQKEEIEAQRDEVESQRDEIERQRDYVIDQRDLIILQKKAITDSIEYAANIQSAILPPLDEMKKVLDNYFIYYKPRDIVSGDFYWAHKIKKKGENRIIAVAADSTGHGVPGAFMSMLGITLLNEIILKKGIYCPSEILDNLKENVVNSLHQTSDIGKSKDGIDLAICYIDFDKKRLEYAGAYNSIYIVRELKAENNDRGQSESIKLNEIKVDRYGSKVLYEIKADKNPIGISHKLNNKYNLRRFNLEAGDVIYLFTDGFADQFGGKKRLKFLYSRFKEMLSSVSSMPLDKQCEEINNQFNTWKGNEKQIDDILVIGIRIS
jgi:serine phosphatase RsbU (regulator of sigma subunit)